MAQRLAEDRVRAEIYKMAAFIFRVDEIIADIFIIFAMPDDTLPACFLGDDGDDAELLFSPFRGLQANRMPYLLIARTRAAGVELAQQVTRISPLLISD